MGPCAKLRVVAEVFFYDGRASMMGENLCLTPQTQCPRTKGEGYVKCHTECSQIGHAEETIIRQCLARGIDFSDISGINVYGQRGPCDHCRDLLATHGLLDVTVFYPDATPPNLDPEDLDGISRAYNL